MPTVVTITIKKVVPARPVERSITTIITVITTTTTTSVQKATLAELVVRPIIFTIVEVVKPTTFLTGQHHFV